MANRSRGERVPRIVLALDASTTAIGWALFDLDKRHPDDLLDHGVKRLKGGLWYRLDFGHVWAKWYMTESQSVDLVALETPVVYRNAKSTIKQAYMVGVLGWVAFHVGVEILELRPDERLTALGLPPRCRNPKPQVVRNVNQIYGLNLDVKTDHDIADAIALGWAARRRLMREGGTL